MLPFGVTIPATVPQRLEIPEGLVNYPEIEKQNGDTTTKENQGLVLERRNNYKSSSTFVFACFTTTSLLGSLTNIKKNNPSL